MASIPPLSTATPSRPTALLRSQLMQARREATQAQDQAEQLRQQLDAQEQEVAQSQKQVRTLESSLSRVNPPSRTPTDVTPKTTTSPAPAEPTYVNTLQAVFRAAQPILELDVSPPQKSIIYSSLFQANEQLQSRSTTSVAAPLSFSAVPLPPRPNLLDTSA